MSISREHVAHAIGLHERREGRVVERLARADIDGSEAPVEVRREIRLGTPPLNRRRQNSVHCTTEQEPRPTTAELLLLGKAEAELDESTVEERVARLDPERSGRLVGNFESEL